MLMLVVLLLLLTSMAVEAPLYTKQNAWVHKRTISFIAALLSLLTSVFCIAYSLPIGILFSIVSIYRIIYLLRIYYARLPDEHLKSVSIKSFFILYNLQLAIILLTLVGLLLSITISIASVLYIFALLSLIGAASIAWSTFTNILRSKPKQATQLTDTELPTVTVAIAARNETPTLVSCLESVLATNYPKLEVLVLDDDSQDTTAEIIKSFAQDGVRFINWEKLDGDWLSKNRAYQTLLQHASGDLILYMGVDVRLHEVSLRRAVEQMLAQDVTMITLVPKRTKSGLLAIFVQPMRYWWEFAIPYLVKKHPPVLSTSWLVRRKELEAIGGFSSYKRSIIPEEHLAKHFSAIDSYAFVRTTQDMLFTTHKTFGSQWDTQVRTRYPHAHRRPEIALLQTFLLSTVVLLPFVILPASFIYSIPALVILITGISALLYVASHVVISIITNPVAGFFAPFNFPVAIALDIIALHVSMYKYEFSKVIWKGRDVAPRKLKVIQKLPELEEPIQGLEKTR